MSVNSIIPVILCGGTGSRLWPLSRQSFPKQFLPLLSKDNNSLLQNTYKRIADLKNLLNPILVCNEEHRFIVAEQMRELNVKTNRILLEPFGKNTAPAIVSAALIALKKEEDPNLLVLSADHEIKNKEKFVELIYEGLKYSNKNRLVTFGVVPKYPETGYGYIKSKQEFDSSKIEGLEISKFIEKPDIDTAKKLIKDKHYTWNSGMFIFKAKTIISEVKKYCPDIFNCCSESLNSSEKDLDFQRIDEKQFSKCPNISIDNAIMEKTDIGTVLPLDTGWTDIGSWDAVWMNSLKDNEGNTESGNVISHNNKNCYFKSEHRLIAGIGLEDLLVIETSDALLVANRNESQKVKNVVEELKLKGIQQGQRHQKIFRPWGNYVSLVEDSRWQVKLILVKPGQKLSLQMHHHRSEHWVVVSGTAKVEIDQKETILSENESIYIPLGSKHRLFNPGKIPLKIIEVQSGSYVGEDDIERFEDEYGRI